MCGPKQEILAGVCHITKALYSPPPEYRSRLPSLDEVNDIANEAGEAKTKEEYCRGMSRSFKMFAAIAAPIWHIAITFESLVQQLDSFNKKNIDGVVEMTSS